MPRTARRRRRIAIAVICCLPTLLLAALWVLGAGTSLISPGRTMPERTAVGITGHNFHFFVASGALDFEDLDSRDRPAEAVGIRATPWGRHMIESRRPARLIGVHRGVEWHGTFATYFTDVAIPMWLLLVCTTPLLLVAAFELRRVVISTRARRAGLCAHCGTVVASGHARCPECGRAVPSVDVVGQLFLAGGSAADIGHDGRNSR